MNCWHCTLEEAREKRAWLKETYNWYSPNVRVLNRINLGWRP
jgi:hypothetical protein